MKRWMVIATIVATMVGIAGLGAGPAMAATPHAPIDINGNSGFNAVNSGVTNQPCGGVLNPVCRINGWQISSGSGGFCIRIQGTTTPYIIENNTCSGGPNGIVLSSAPNGTVRQNTISGLNGTTGSFDANAIMMDQSNNTTIAGNQISNIRGANGTSTHKDGGSAFGIHLGRSATVDVESNRISQVSGGFGFSGTATSPNGGNGGSGFGIRAQGGAPTTLALVLGPVSLQFGAPISTLLGPVVDMLRPVLAPMLAVTPSNLDVKNNNISGISGSFGAIGAYVGSGTGGKGGNGGSAAAASVDGGTTSYADVHVTGNTMNTMSGSSGAIGGSGRSGGDGGSGGSAHGVQLVNVGGGTSTVTGNTITGVYGASGAIGGSGVFGLGVGGRGGNGGDAIGIRKSNVTVNPFANNISFLFAGTGALGGFPGGANGQSGQARAIV